MEEKRETRIKILFIEDNQDDIDLTIATFKRCKISNPIKVIKNGQEALDYLKKICFSNDITSSAIPNLILLDLNLPKVSGIEILEFIKTTEKIKRVPVVILTTSRRDEDIVESYDLHVNSYIQKPVTLDKFTEIIENFRLYWLLTNVADYDWKK